MTHNLPIGVFDSGVGGLTVLRALADRLPTEDFLYLGDTARLPYGTKSPDTIRRYAVQAADALVARGVKLLVIACNTASAHGLSALREAWPELPVVGVIEPGAAAAAAASETGRIAVLATESTISAGAYPAAIQRLRPDAAVSGIACTLLVGLAEEGWQDGPEAEAVVARYLRGLPAERPDVLVLGCTHFPLLAPAIRRVAGSGVTLVDSAATTAAAVADALAASGLGGGGKGRIGLLATDGAARFARVAGHFLKQPVTEGMVEVVNL